MTVGEEEEEDFTAAVRPALPPLEPKQLVLGAVVLVALFGVIIAAAISFRMGEDRRDHPDCATWRSQHEALTNQALGDEPGDSMGLVHQFQLQEWDKKRPAGCT